MQALTELTGYSGERLAGLPLGVMLRTMDSRNVKRTEAGWTVETVIVARRQNWTPEGDITTDVSTFLMPRAEVMA